MSAQVFCFLKVLATFISSNNRSMNQLLAYTGIFLHNTHQVRQKLFIRNI